MTNRRLRRAWFQVHKWIGLTLAVLIIPLSLSGAALVWDDTLDRALNPAHYAVSGETTIDPARYAAVAAGLLAPGERIASLTLPRRDGGPVIVAANKGGKPAAGGPPSRTMIWLDPPTARVLARGDSSAGVMRTIHVLHGSLLIPGAGRQIVGWIGVAMMVSCFTGLWLWWPTVGRWSRGLRWRRHRDTDTNLHHLAGFWVALPLFVLSLTGAWIAFPQFFGMFSNAPARGGPDRGALFRARPLEHPATPLDTVIARAQAAASGKVAQVTWPTERSPDWQVSIARDHAPPQTLAVADDDGAATIAPDRDSRDPLARLMRSIHDGDGMGPVWRTVIFIAGLLPALLAVTGIVMWWRARKWRVRVRAV